MDEGRLLLKLQQYRALDNRHRLQAYLAVSKSPDISFNELARSIGLERGLLAYHLGVLKAAGLVQVTYRRISKETSRYSLTKGGKRLLRKLARE